MYIRLKYNLGFISIKFTISLRGSVRVVATRAIAPVNFQKNPFASVDFPKTISKKRKFDSFDWIWS